MRIKNINGIIVDIPIYDYEIIPKDKVTTLEIMIDIRNIFSLYNVLKGNNKIILENEEIETRPFIIGKFNIVEYNTPEVGYITMLGTQLSRYSNEMLKIINTIDDI